MKMLTVVGSGLRTCHAAHFLVFSKLPWFHWSDAQLSWKHGMQRGCQADSRQCGVMASMWVSVIQYWISNTKFRSLWFAVLAENGRAVLNVAIEVVYAASAASATHPSHAALHTGQHSFCSATEFQQRTRDLKIS